MHLTCANIKHVSAYARMRRWLSDLFGGNKVNGNVEVVKPNRRTGLSLFEQCLGYFRTRIVARMEHSAAGMSAFQAQFKRMRRVLRDQGRGLFGLVARSRSLLARKGHPPLNQFLDAIRSFLNDASNN